MYTELQCKTNFSFLRGASEASEYIERAASIGIPSLAITDRNGVYALPRAFEAIQNFPEVKLISGCELVLRDHPPLTLIARDRSAYGLMCQMLTAAHAGKEKGDAHLSVLELLRFLEQPESLGLVGLVSVADNSNYALLRQAFDKRLYLALSMYLDGMDDVRKRKTLEVSSSFDLRVVATNDVHYHLPERRKLQDAVTCVREGVSLRTAGFKLFGNEERYLKTPLQMRALFRDFPDAIRATSDIAESCTFSMRELKYQYPSEWIPAGYSAQEFLEELVWEGAKAQYKGLIPSEVEKQIHYEFDLTKRMGYADYFLTVYDIVSFAKGKNIYCQGRGSAANSIICYCLGITIIDPVKMSLLFERFISEERGEPPDIDVDFEHDRREEVIQYIYTKYGRDRAAMISAVRTYRKRSSFLEMSKAVGVPVGTISYDELDVDFDKIAGDLVYKRNKIEQLASELYGFPRHLSIHACGFTLSAKAITDTVPIEPARMEGRTICQWDKNDLDTLKLIKIDVLSLGFLTVIHKACDLLGRHFSQIPLEDDPEVYRMIQNADTIGTFQIESRAQICTLGITLPENFYDLVVEVALVRPGPNVGDMKNPYITRKENAKKGIPYLITDPVIEKILGRTYGVPIFQEQVMRLAVEKAGFSPGEADQLRRAIAAWRSAGGIDSLSQRFYQGLIAGGMDEPQAKELFSYLKGFSEYGFPESHAASFAILSYISAWLKHYHPTELLCGLINSQPMGFYPIDVLINDAKRHGVQVLPVDPNISIWDATREAPGVVRMGFREIQGMRKDDFEHLATVRSQKAFSSLEDFLFRTTFSRDVITTMAMSDVFIIFGLDQRHSFWGSLEFKSIVSSQGEKSTSQQLTLFPAFCLKPKRRQPIFDKMSLYEGILEDYRGLGYSLRGNAMAGIRAQNLSLPKLTSQHVLKKQHGTQVIFAGILQVLQRPPTAKGVAFITMEDEFGSLNLVLFKRVYERYVPVIRGSRFLVITGKIEKRGQGISVMVQAVRAFGPLHKLSSKKLVRPGEHPRNIPSFV